MRKYLLILVVAIMALIPVGLRIKSHLNAPATGLDSPSAATRPAVSALPVPRDYVSDPNVVPEETEAGPRRIISLAPSVTEIVCALGMQDRLVGRTRYCSWPPGIQSVPAVGVMAESNYGLIKSLAPDLVLAARNSGDTVADLTRLGLRCVPVPHEGLPELFAAIEEVGRLCDRPRTAEALVAAIQADIEQLRAAVKTQAKPPKRVIVLFGELPVPPKAVFVAGPGLFLDVLVEYAGHVNAAREVLKSSQGEIPLELLRVLDPEMILEFREPTDAAAMADVYSAWSRVGDLQAIRERRVRTVGGEEWLSAGPRFAIELHRFISALSEVD